MIKAVEAVPAELAVQAERTLAVCVYVTIWTPDIVKNCGCVWEVDRLGLRDQ